MSSQDDLIKSIKKICICKSVNQGAITAAMQEGALSFESLRKVLRVGTGYCKAKRCRPKIQALLKEHRDSLEEAGHPQN